MTGVGPSREIRAFQQRVVAFALCSTTAETCSRLPIVSVVSCSWYFAKSPETASVDQAEADEDLDLSVCKGKSDESRTSFSGHSSMLERHCALTEAVDRGSERSFFGVRIRVSHGDGSMSWPSLDDQVWKQWA